MVALNNPTAPHLALARPREKRDEIKLKLNK